MNEHQTELLGAYVLGVLPADEHAAVQHHLRTCTMCRVEADELREMETALSGLVPEALIEGPPVDGDLLLHRTLRQVRDERTRGSRTRRLLLAAAAAVTGVTVLAGGIVLGRATAPQAPTAAPTAGPSTSMASGTRTGTATDPATGISMTVQVEPAAGWVRVHAKVSGVAPGEQCSLWVTARDGTRQLAGSWVVGGPASRVDGSTAVAPNDVVSVQVETFAGVRLVTVGV